MNKLKTIGTELTAASAFLATRAQFALAAEENCDVTGGIKAGAACSNPGTPTTLFGTGGLFSTIATTLIFIVGAISVIYLIIGGLKYVVSNGEASAVKSAKDTILYAIIGIVVAIIAFALVNFVIGSFIK